jgi:uncharacterized protein YfiM (DUF2279 family)
MGTRYPCDTDVIAQLAIALMVASADTAQPVPERKTVQVEVDQWIGEDKLKHFAFSLALTSGSAGAARAVTNHDTSIIAGAAVGLVAGIGKEIYDHGRVRSASFRDLLWDVAGVTVGVLIAQQAR